MSNGFHPTGCVYDGQDLQANDLSIDLEVIVGLDEVAEVRGTDTTIPSKAGRRARNRVKDRRSIELGGWLQGVGEFESVRMASYRQIVAFLQTLFDPARDPATLSVPLEDGTTATISARPLVIVYGDRPLPGVCRISVSLESIDPDWAYSGS